MSEIKRTLVADGVAARFAFRNATHEERLLLYLFEDYEPVARAVMDSNQTVTVSIDFVLLRIHGLVSRITMIYRRTLRASHELRGALCPPKRRLISSCRCRV